jgi:hypothetical protein
MGVRAERRFAVNPTSIPPSSTKVWVFTQKDRQDALTVFLIVYNFVDALGKCSIIAFVDE